MTAYFRPEPDETIGEQHAREAMQEIATAMHYAIVQAKRDGLRVLAIEVPRSFPKHCDGAKMYGTPVRYADVDEPRVATEPRLRILGFTP